MGEIQCYELIIRCNHLSLDEFKSRQVPTYVQYTHTLSHTTLLIHVPNTLADISCRGRLHDIQRHGGPADLPLGFWIGIFSLVQRYYCVIESRPTCVACWHALCEVDRVRQKSLDATPEQVPERFQRQIQMLWTDGEAREWRCSLEHLAFSIGVSASTTKLTESA